MAGSSLSGEWRRRCHPQRHHTECPPLIITLSIEEGGWFGGLRVGAGIELSTDYSGSTQYDRVSVNLGSAARTRRTNEFGREQRGPASRLAQNKRAGDAAGSALRGI